MGEEEDDEEVEVITATPLRFPRPVLSATTHLVPIGAHGIPGFGQFRQPVVMTLVSATTQPIVETQTIETRAIAESHPTPMEIVAPDPIYRERKDPPQTNN